MTETESEAETEETVNTRSNMMMAFAAAMPADYDEYILGGSIYRHSVKTVTFLDSLDTVGANAWDVSIDGDGTVLAWTTDAGDGNYNLYIGADGKVLASEEETGFLCNFLFLTSVDFGGNFDTSNITYMACWFDNCDSLTEIDLSTLDTSNVENMNNMFAGCTSLKSVILTGIDTSHVLYMGGNVFRMRNARKPGS